MISNKIRNKTGMSTLPYLLSTGLEVLANEGNQGDTMRKERNQSMLI